MCPDDFPVPGQFPRPSMNRELLWRSHRWERGHHPSQDTPPRSRPPPHGTSHLSTAGTHLGGDFAGKLSFAGKYDQISGQALVGRQTLSGDRGNSVRPHTEDARQAIASTGQDTQAGAGSPLSRRAQGLPAPVMVSSESQACSAGAGQGSLAETDPACGAQALPQRGGPRSCHAWALGEAAPSPPHGQPSPGPHDQESAEWALCDSLIYLE